MRDIQSLTALRGFAAIWIVLHHFWPQTSSQTPYLISKGYLAVDLFFILSGVVLYLVYSDALRLGTFDMKRFALKRFARLYPVHFLTLILMTTVLTLGPKLGFEARQVTYNFVEMFFLHATLLHAWGISETGGLNYPSWSLSAEAFAYLLFPSLTLAVLKFRFALRWSLLFLAISIGLSQLFWPDVLRNPNDILVFTRMENDFGVLRIIPEFILGLSIAKHTRDGAGSGKWFIVGLLLVIVGICANFDALTVFGFAALIGAGVGANPNAPRFFRRIGELSYCIYMIHAFVQIVGFKIIERLFSYQDSEVPVGFIIPLLGATMLFALALHIWCERPIHHWLLYRSTTKSVRPKAARFFPM